MYQEFYSLNAMPFENTADPRFFFASEQHREAVAAIEYTVRMRKGYVLVTGGVGSGKTTVSRVVTERCAPHATVISLLHGHHGGEPMLRQLLRAMRVRYRGGDDHGRLLERLREQFQHQAAISRPVVLLVDEAQACSDETLEELRLLSNFDTPTQKLVQTVLVGQPELRQRILSAKFDALRQRIVIAKELQPLGLAETKAYINHRLAEASLDAAHVAPVFTDEAIDEVHRYSRGTPRVINFACDGCLLLGFVRQTRAITPAMVQRVIADMLPSVREPQIVVTPQARMSLAGSV